MGARLIGAITRNAVALVALAITLAGCGRDRTPPAAPGPEPPRVPRFTDVLPDSGITFRHKFLDWETGSNYRVSPYDHGSGVCVADFDGDGRDDVYFLNFRGPNALYLNRGGLRFEDVSARSGVAMGREVCVAAAAGDYDNDGDADMYVTTYRGGNRLFRNRGDATFEDVTERARVGYVGHSSGATWLDYDNDGDLDLYLVNVGRFTTDKLSSEDICAYEGVQLPFGEFALQPDLFNPGEANILWRNEGDGTFANVTRASGLTAAEWNADATAADVDLDGDLDLYVSNMFGPNHLFINQGDGTFRETTDRALGRTSWGGMGCKFFEANGDDYPDLVVMDMHSDMWIEPDKADGVRSEVKYDGARGPAGGGKAIVAASDTKARRVLFGNTFFVNRGDGRFVERSTEAGLETWQPWGVAVGDFNNDGSADIFIPSGMGFPYFHWPNALMLNDGAGRFREAAAEAGLEPPRLGKIVAGAEIATYMTADGPRPGAPFARSSRAAAAADFDGDGDLDLVVNNFHHEPYLLRNDSPPGRFLRVRLHGRTANADGVGARVVVHAGGRSWSQQASPGGGYLAQGSAVLHFGLGPHARVDRVEVYWPGGRTAQAIERPTINQILHIRQ